MRTLILLLVGGIITIGWMLSLKPESEKTKPPPVMTVDRIVSQLRTVEELASLKVAVSGIVSGTQPGARFWQGESRLVLLARGHAIYSVDLSRIEVVVTGSSVTITLPEPQISDYWVDVDRTEVWERRTGRFRLDEGLSLQSACWADALAMVHEAAASSSHRQMARAHAEQTVHAVVRGAPGGATTHRVEVRWQGRASGPPRQHLG